MTVLENARRHATVIFVLSLLFVCHASWAEARLERPPGTTRYAAFVRDLKSWKNWDNKIGYHRMTVQSIGTSVLKRHIWMVTLVGTNANSPRKLLCICRQHGHEPASTEGALALIHRLVYAPPGSEEAQWLDRVSISIIPMANPDGAEAYLRHNAHDVDINRDWIKRSQPEIRALYAEIWRLHPDLMTDQHELYPDDTRPDFTETAGPISGASASVIRSCIYDSGVVQVAMGKAPDPKFAHWIDDNHPPRLAHRFGCIVLGIPTILFETNRLAGTGRTVADRADAHELFMVSCLRLMAGEDTKILQDAGYTIDSIGTPTPINGAPGQPQTIPQTGNPQPKVQPEEAP